VTVYFFLSGSEAKIQDPTGSGPASLDHSFKFYVSIRSPGVGVYFLKLGKTNKTCSTVLQTSDADPHHFDVDPDPAFHFDADLDPTFQFLRIQILSFNFFQIWTLHAPK
jgi:hypothetical protein